MKSFKKVLAAGLAATMLVTATSITASATDIVHNRKPLHYTEKYYYSLLTSREKEIYKHVYQCAQQGKNADITRYSVTQKELEHIRDAFYYENPEFDIQHKAWSNEVVYCSNDLSKKRALERADDEILNKALKLNTDYERISYFHDYIVDHTIYQTNDDYKYSQSAYGALCGGKASCEGYTDAFMYLCQQVGIECIKVVGTISVPDEWHAWNMVKLEDNWFNVDVCWDDNQGDETLYNFFLASDDTFGKTHYPELTLDLPDAASSFMDYGCSTTTDCSKIFPKFRNNQFVQVTTDNEVIGSNLFNVSDPSKLKVSTSDSNVAYVNSKGTVVFKNPGKVWVTGEYKGESAKVFFKVYKGDIPLEDTQLKEPVKDTHSNKTDDEIAIRKPKLVVMDDVIVIEKGETVNITNYFNPNVFDDIEFTVHYNRRFKAAVNYKRDTVKITGKKLGTSYIYATYNGVKYAYKVKVVNPVTAAVITRKYVKSYEDIYNMDFEDLEV